MLALTNDGRITECRATEIGKGRCNHIAHQTGSKKEFMELVNSKYKVMPTVRNKVEKPLTEEQKKELSGNFVTCHFIKEEKKEEISDLINKSNDSMHNAYDNDKRTDKVGDYEKEFPGIPQEMFIVDRNHIDGKEVHVIKTNGIIEIYNLKKLVTGKNSRITRLIARPSQTKRYYKWVNCIPPSYLININRENQENMRNEW